MVTIYAIDFDFNAEKPMVRFSNVDLNAKSEDLEYELKDYFEDVLGMTYANSMWVVEDEDTHEKIIFRNGERWNTIPSGW